MKTAEYITWAIGSIGIVRAMFVQGYGACTGRSGANVLALYGVLPNGGSNCEAALRSV